MSKPFFESKIHPGLVMNRYGVVMALRGHPLAADDLWGGVDWTHVPLKRGSLSIRCEVEDEAIASGYSYVWKNNERVYSKPKKVHAL